MDPSRGSSRAPNLKPEAATGPIVPAPEYEQIKHLPIIFADYLATVDSSVVVEADRVAIKQFMDKIAAVSGKLKSQSNAKLDHRVIPAVIWKQIDSLNNSEIFGIQLKLVYGAGFNLGFSGGVLPTVGPKEPKWNKVAPITEIDDAGSIDQNSYDSGKSKITLSSYIENNRRLSKRFTSKIIYELVSAIHETHRMYMTCSSPEFRQIPTELDGALQESSVVQEGSASAKTTIANNYGKINNNKNEGGGATNIGDLKTDVSPVGNKVKYQYRYSGRYSTSSPHNNIISPNNVIITDDNTIQSVFEALSGDNSSFGAHSGDGGSTLSGSLVAGKESKDSSVASISSKGSKSSKSIIGNLNTSGSKKTKVDTESKGNNITKRVGFQSVENCSNQFEGASRPTTVGNRTSDSETDTETDASRGSTRPNTPGRDLTPPKKGKLIPIISTTQKKRSGNSSGSSPALAILVNEKMDNLIDSNIDHTEKKEDFIKLATLPREGSPIRRSRAFEVIKRSIELWYSDRETVIRKLKSPVDVYGTRRGSDSDDSDSDNGGEQTNKSRLRSAWLDIFSLKVRGLLLDISSNTHAEDARLNCLCSESKTPGLSMMNSESSVINSKNQLGRSFKYALDIYSDLKDDVYFSRSLILTPKTGSSCMNSLKAVNFRKDNKEITNNWLFDDLMKLDMAGTGSVTLRSNSPDVVNLIYHRFTQFVLNVQHDMRQLGLVLFSILLKRRLSYSEKLLLEKVIIVDKAELKAKKIKKKKKTMPERIAKSSESDSDSAHLENEDTDLTSENEESDSPHPKRMSTKRGSKDDNASDDSSDEDIRPEGLYGDQREPELNKGKQKLTIDMLYDKFECPRFHKSVSELLSLLFAPIVVPYNPYISSSINSSKICADVNYHRGDDNTSINSGGSSFTSSKLNNGSNGAGGGGADRRFKFIRFEKYASSIKEFKMIFNRMDQEVKWQKPVFWNIKLEKDRLRSIYERQIALAESAENGHEDCLERLQEYDYMVWFHMQSDAVRKKILHKKKMEEKAEKNRQERRKLLHIAAIHFWNRTEFKKWMMSAFADCFKTTKKLQKQYLYCVNGRKKVVKPPTSNNDKSGSLLRSPSRQGTANSATSDKGKSDKGLSSPSRIIKTTEKDIRTTNTSSNENSQSKILENVKGKADATSKSSIGKSGASVNADLAKTKGKVALSIDVVEKPPDTQEEKKRMNKHSMEYHDMKKMQFIVDLFDADFIVRYLNFRQVECQMNNPNYSEYDYGTDFKVCFEIFFKDLTTLILDEYYKDNIGGMIRPSSAPQSIDDSVKALFENGVGKEALKKKRVDSPYGASSRPHSRNPSRKSRGSKTRREMRVQVFDNSASAEGEAMVFNNAALVAEERRWINIIIFEMRKARDAAFAKIENSPIMMILTEEQIRIKSEIFVVENLMRSLGSIKSIIYKIAVAIDFLNEDWIMGVFRICLTAIYSKFLKDLPSMTKGEGMAANRLSASFRMIKIRNLVKQIWRATYAEIEAIEKEERAKKTKAILDGDGSFLDDIIKKQEKAMSLPDPTNNEDDIYADEGENETLGSNFRASGVKTKQNRNEFEMLSPVVIDTFTHINCRVKSYRLRFHQWSYSSSSYRSDYYLTKDNPEFTALSFNISLDFSLSNYKASNCEGFKYRNITKLNEIKTKSHMTPESEVIDVSHIAALAIVLRHPSNSVNRIDTHLHVSDVSFAHDNALSAESKNSGEMVILIVDDRMPLDISLVCECLYLHLLGEIKKVEQVYFVNHPADPHPPQNYAQGFGSPHNYDKDNNLSCAFREPLVLPFSSELLGSKSRVFNDGCDYAEIHKIGFMVGHLLSNASYNVSVYYNNVFAPKIDKVRHKRAFNYYYDFTYKWRSDDSDLTLLQRYFKFQTKATVPSCIIKESVSKEVATIYKPSATMQSPADSILTEKMDHSPLVPDSNYLLNIICVDTDYLISKNAVVNTALSLNSSPLLALRIHLSWDIPTLNGAKCSATIIKRKFAVYYRKENLTAVTVSSEESQPPTLEEVTLFTSKWVSLNNEGEIEERIKDKTRKKGKNDNIKCILSSFTDYISFAEEIIGTRRGYIDNFISSLDLPPTYFSESSSFGLGFFVRVYYSLCYETQEGLRSVPLKIKVDTSPKATILVKPRAPTEKKTHKGYILNGGLFAPSKLVDKGVLNMNNISQKQDNITETLGISSVNMELSSNDTGSTKSVRKNFETEEFLGSTDGNSRFEKVSSSNSVDRHETGDVTNPNIEVDYWVSSVAKHCPI